MNRILTITLTLCFVALVGTQANAQQAISPQKEVLIKELLTLTGGKEEADKAASIMLAFQQEQTAKMIAEVFADDKTMSPETKTELQTMMSETTASLTKRMEEFFRTELDINKAIEEVTLPFYNKNFTEAELQQMVAFYRTPAAQKSIKLTPELMMETMRLFSEKLMPKMTEFIKKATQEEVEKFRQKVDGGAAKSKPISKV
jgi:hypothetical protein